MIPGATQMTADRINRSHRRAPSRRCLRPHSPAFSAVAFQPSCRRLKEMTRPIMRPLCGASLPGVGVSVSTARKRRTRVPLDELYMNTIDRAPFASSTLEKGVGQQGVRMHGRWVLGEVSTAFPHELSV